MWPLMLRRWRSIVLVVGVHATDLIAEEARRLVTGVGDQRLLCRQFQLEVIAQVVAKPLFDRLGFLFGAGKAQQPIIRIPEVVQPAIVGVVRVLGGKLPSLPIKRPGFIPSPALPQSSCLLRQYPVARMGLAAPALVMSGEELCFHEPIELVQVDIRENGGRDAALWRAAQGRLVPPVFEISRLKEALEQVQEAVIVDLLTDDSQQDAVVDVVEAPFDVSLDEPLRSRPAVDHV